MLKFDNLKKKYLTLIPFLALNLVGREINTQNINLEKIHINPIDHFHNIKNLKYQEHSNIKLKFNNLIYLLAEKINSSKTNKDINIESLDIISDSQYKSENKYTVEGDVQIKKNNSELKADKLVYDLEKKIITITGNIKFFSGDQFLQSTKIKYNLISKKGFIKDAYGIINFDTLNLINADNNTNFDFKNISDNKNSITDVKLNKTSTLEFDDIKSPQKLKIELNPITKWRFKSNEIKIEDKIWSSDILYLTNDPYNEPQIVIKNSDFKILEKNGEMMIKSKWSSVILEDKVKVPIGPRNYKSKKGSNLKWGFGYERNNKDGLYITRYADPIRLGNSNVNFNKEFYIQRALSGKTKSFSKKNNSVLAEKVEQDSKTSDYFGFKADINSDILGLDFNSEISLNSLDLEKFKKIISTKTELSKIIDSYKKEDFEKESKISLFGTYRDKVWNGSLGENDILTAYGIKIANNKKWETNKVEKLSTIAVGYGEYQSNKKSTNAHIISRERLNLLWYREHNYPIWNKKNDSPINEEFIYSPEFTNKGLDFLVSTKVDLYRYSDGNYQNLFTLKAGPKITLGNLKKRYLDYSEISILGKTTISRGESPFDFDQAVDKHNIEINFNQQLIGPLVMQYSTEYNLDINSSNFHEFSNNKYQLSWNRRAFNIGIFYNEDRQSGGINFKINGFNFKGYGNEFR